MNVQLKFFIFYLAIISFVPQTFAQIQCDNDTTGLIPLVDLQEDYFMGLYQGGLYPGGSNIMPLAHRQAGNKIAKSIKPLDTLGHVDWENGKVVMTSFGASTTGEPFNHFIADLNFHDEVNPCFAAVTGTNGGKGLDVMQHPEAYPDYWDYVMDRIRAKGYTPEQIQIAWFKSGSKTDTIVEMPIFPNAIADRYAACLQLVADSFPNLKMVFMSGFYYGGYGDPTKEFFPIISEPGAYYNNFATKWLVERQINGDTALKFTGPDRVTPWIAWGPYEWADGINPNIYDGLFWNCEEDFTEDGGGYHLTNFGKEKEADLLFNFFSTNPISKRWFLDGPKWNSCDPFGRLSDGKDYNTPEENEITVQDIQLYPSPNDGNFYLKFAKAHTGYANINIVNNMGQVVFEYAMNSFKPNEGITININHEAAGIYYLNVNVDGEILSKEFVIYH